jgi:hypothetical protein
MLVNVECALLSIGFDDGYFVCRKSVSNPTRSFTMESQFRGLQRYKYNTIAFHFWTSIYLQVYFGAKIISFERARAKI